jgi:hypothetical protein
MVAVLVEIELLPSTQAAHSVKTLRHWPWLQLVVLSVLSVSDGCVAVEVEGRAASRCAKYCASSTEQ